MPRIIATLFAVCLSVSMFAGQEAPRQKSKAPVLLSFADLKWTDVPQRKGSRMAVLSGDPATGAFTEIRTVPAGTDSPLHTHSSELKNVIISGVWYIGADAASVRDFGPGSVIVMPANWVHVSGCRPGNDCLFYEEGNGKFDYKPSVRDPRRAAH